MTLQKFVFINLARCKSFTCAVLVLFFKNYGFKSPRKRFLIGTNYRFSSEPRQKTIVIDPDHRFGLNRAGTTSTACTPRVSFFFKLLHVPHPGGLKQNFKLWNEKFKFGVACIMKHTGQGCGPVRSLFVFCFLFMYFVSAVPSCFYYFCFCFVFATTFAFDFILVFCFAFVVVLFAWQAASNNGDLWRHPPTWMYL